jgi:hypothetical protein
MLTIGWLLSILIRRLLAITGLAIGIWKGRVRCTAGYRTTPRHSTLAVLF